MIEAICCLYGKFFQYHFFVPFSKYQSTVNFIPLSKEVDGFQPSNFSPLVPSTVFSKTPSGFSLLYTNSPSHSAK